MRIEVYEILATNSLSGSRIIINDNFKMLEEGLNSLYNNIDIDEEGKMTINDIYEMSTHKLTVSDNQNKTSLIVDENGHLWIKGVGEGSEMIDVNTVLSKLQNNQHSGESESGSDEEYDETAELMEQVAGNIQSVSEGGTVEYEYINE